MRVSPPSLPRLETRVARSRDLPLRATGQRYTPQTAISRYENEHVSHPPSALTRGNIRRGKSSRNPPACTHRTRGDHGRHSLHQSDALSGIRDHWRGRREIRFYVHLRQTSPHHPVRSDARGMRRRWRWRRGVRPHPPSPAVDTSSQRATTTPSKATTRPPKDETSNTYVVEALTGHKPGTEGMPLFLVRWYGCAADDETWEPANYID